jgi:hypothetical protein
MIWGSISITLTFDPSPLKRHANSIPMYPPPIMTARTGFSVLI